MDGDFRTLDSQHPTEGKPSAAYVLPAVLDNSRFEQHRQEFLAEYRPVGATECMLVRELARHAAAAERWSTAADAAARTTARNLPALATTFPLQDDVAADDLLAGAMAAEAVQQCERHSLARSRAFYRVQARLEQIQARRGGRLTEISAVPPPFADETACRKYLEERRQIERRPCPACGHENSCYLPSRRVWECGNCRKQISLRFGSVMADSALPLLVWFNAIRALLLRPTMSTAELAEHVGLRRMPTVRKMARRIREAMGADDAGVRLVGLDRRFAQAAENLS